MLWRGVCLIKIKLRQLAKPDICRDITTGPVHGGVGLETVSPCMDRDVGPINPINRALYINPIKLYCLHKLKPNNVETSPLYRPNDHSVV